MFIMSANMSFNAKYFFSEAGGVEVVQPSGRGLGTVVLW